MTGLAYIIESTDAFTGVDGSEYPTLTAKVDSTFDFFKLLYPNRWLYEIAGSPFGDKKRGFNKFVKKYADKMRAWIIENIEKEPHIENYE